MTFLIKPVDAFLRFKCFPQWDPDNTWIVSLKYHYYIHEVFALIYIYLITGVRNLRSIFLEVLGVQNFGKSIIGNEYKNEE